MSPSSNGHPSESSDSLAIESTAFEFAYNANEPALQFPDLRIAKGQRVALVGPSGCGKTTLLRLIAGLLVAPKPIHTLGCCLSQENDSDRRLFRLMKLGLIFQEFQLLEYLSASQNIFLPFRMHRGIRPDATKADRVRRLERLACQLGVNHKLGSKPSQLSHGEKQRVAVARALMMKPHLILADEPTASLDSQPVAPFEARNSHKATGLKKQPDAKGLDGNTQRSTNVDAQVDDRISNRDRVIEALLAATGPGRGTLVCATHDLALADRCDQVIDLTNQSISRPRNSEGQA